MSAVPQWQACRAHLQAQQWCKCFRVTNRLLDEWKATATWGRKRRWGAHWPTGLNGHSIHQTALPIGLSTRINQRCSQPSFQKPLGAVGGRCLTQKVRLVKVHKVSACRVFNHKQDIYVTHPLTKARGPLWKKRKTDYKSQRSRKNGVEWCHLDTSRMLALVNSQQLWL